MHGSFWKVKRPFLTELDKRPNVGMITGWKEEIVGKDKEELNVDFIIRKPFDLSELTKNINDVFGADSR